MTPLGKICSKKYLGRTRVKRKFTYGHSKIGFSRKTTVENDFKIA